MVHISSFLGAAALLSSFVAALPRPDSSINEPAVSAPNGTPITDTSVPIATSVSSTGGSANSSPMSSDSSSSMDSSSTDSSSSNSPPMDSSSGGSGDMSSSSYGSGSSYGSSGSSGSSYGSGSSNWNSDGYNSCVQQCVANYGSMSSSYTPTATTSYGGSDSSSSGGSDSSMSSSSDSSSSSGSGATHTVIVAPTQGVLRFVPFAVNASVGDTVKFMWGANNHTVTKSSELTPCNKTSDNLFASGEQNLGFVFEQVVNDTNPIFFYCGTPTHCEKGMFGIINPPNALGAPTSVSGMMQSLLVSNPDLSAYNAYTEKQTSGKGAVNQWGGNIDLASLPEWSQPYVAQNVLYTRNLVASNPDILQGDGSINVGAAGSNPLMIPQDISAYLSSAVPSAAASTPAPAVTSAAAPASSAPASTGSMSNGASSMASPKVVVGLVAAFATFLVL